MIAVPTRRPATTIRTRDFRRPMLRAARRARSGRRPTTIAARMTPARMAHADQSGRAISSAPRLRLLDDLPVPHPQVPMAAQAAERVVRHALQGLPRLAVQAREEVLVLAPRLELGFPGRARGPA